VKLARLANGILTPCGSVGSGLAEAEGLKIRAAMNAKRLLDYQIEAIIIDRQAESQSRDFAIAGGLMGYGGDFTQKPCPSRCAAPPFASVTQIMSDDVEGAAKGHQSAQPSLADSLDRWPIRLNCEADSNLHPPRPRRQEGAAATLCQSSGGLMPRRCDPHHAMPRLAFHSLADFDALFTAASASFSGARCSPFVDSMRVHGAIQSVSRSAPAKIKVARRVLALQVHGRPDGPFIFCASHDRARDSQPGY
jgi:hypothetical protein